MAELQGSAAKAAYESSGEAAGAGPWGTAVVLNGGDQFEYASETVTPEVELIESDQITGEALPGASDTGSVTVEGDLSGMDMKYSGHERFVRDVFGDLTTTNPGITHFQHVANFEESNEGYYGTMAIEKVVTGPHEVDSYKPMGIDIVGAPGEFNKITITGIGRQLRTKDPGRTNDASASWTLPVYTRRVARFGQVVFSVALADVSPSYTDFCVSGFNLSFQRNFDPAFTTCDGDFSSEPSTDTIEMTGSVDFPIYDTENDPWVDWNLSKVVLTGRVTIDSGVVIPGSTPSQNYEWVIWLPAFQLNDGYPNVPGLGRVPLTASFTLHTAEIPVDTDAVLPRIYIHNEVADIDDYTT